MICLKNSNEHKSAWRLLALALGEKSGKNEKESDIIALIRLIIILQAVLTNGFIIANAVYNLSGGPVKKQSTSPPATDYQCYTTFSSKEKSYDI